VGEPPTTTWLRSVPFGVCHGEPTAATLVGLGGGVERKLTEPEVADDRRW
jgi:hypothetical protein